MKEDINSSSKLPRGGSSGVVKRSGPVFVGGNGRSKTVSLGRGRPKVKTTTFRLYDIVVFFKRLFTRIFSAYSDRQQQVAKTLFASLKADERDAQGLATVVNELMEQRCVLGSEQFNTLVDSELGDDKNSVTQKLKEASVLCSKYNPENEALFKFALILEGRGLEEYIQDSFNAFFAVIFEKQEVTKDEKIMISSLCLLLGGDEVKEHLELMLDEAFDNSVKTPGPEKTLKIVKDAYEFVKEAHTSDRSALGYHTLCLYAFLKLDKLQKKYPLKEAAGE